MIIFNIDDNLKIKEIYQKYFGNNMDPKNLVSYYDIHIIKKHNKTRVIHAPFDNLKMCAREILDFINKNIKFSENTYGYIKNKNVVSAILPHIRSTFFCRADIKNFFPSFDYSYIFNKLQDFGLAKDTASILTYLTVDENNKMVLGSPLSPFITNLMLIKFDTQMDNWSKKYNYIYSRYVDDIMISSIKDENSWTIEFILDTIQSILKNTVPFLKLNRKKIKNHKFFVGMTIPEINKISISRKHIRHKLKSILFNLGKEGKELKDLPDSVLGLLNWTKTVNNIQYNYVYNGFLQGKKMLKKNTKRDKND